MKKIYYTLGIAIALSLAATADVSTYTTNFAVNASVPDGSEYGMQDTRNLSGFGLSIESLSVSLELAPTTPSEWCYNGDYYVSLQHADGFSVLLNRVGRSIDDHFGYDDNGFNITLTASGEDIHTYRQSNPVLNPYFSLTGEWGADGRMIDPADVLAQSERTRGLDQFNELDPNGEWTLFIADLSPGGSASLISWGLEIDSVVPEPSSTILMACTALSLAFIRRIIT